MRFKVLLFLSLWHPNRMIKGEETDHLKGFLLYEDQKQKVCSSSSCWNALTLKRKMFETEKSVEDFTVCHRIYLLSYRKITDSSGFIFEAKTNKFGSTDIARSSHKLAPGFFHRLYYSTDAFNGWHYLATFNEKVQEVIKSNGIYAIWPEYEENVNANEWNSFCSGTDFKKRKAFLVRNGKTVANFTQSDLWAEVNTGIDTSILEPFNTLVNNLISFASKEINT